LLNNADVAGSSAQAAAPSIAHGAETDPLPVSRPRRDYTLRRLLAAADTLAIVTGLGVTEVAVGGPEASEQFTWGIVSLPVWILVFKMYGLYDRDGKRVSHSTVDDVPWLFHALVIGSIVLLLLMRLTPAELLTYSQGATFFGAALAATIVYRALVRYCARRALAPERVVFVGGGSMASILVNKIRLHPEYRLKPVGYVDAATAEDRGVAPDLPYLGDVSGLEAACLNVGADRVVVVSRELSSDLVVESIRLTKSLDLRMSVLPDTADVLGPSLEIDDVEGITILGINPPALTRSSRLLKRTLDAVIASFALLITLPLIAVVALMVRLSSPGPVFYMQERVGRGGRRFRIVKFRTMAADAEAKAESLRELSTHPVWLLLDRDPRITPVGRVLRRYSLDELPQLWNVLRGDMSLVGPRPMPPEVDKQIQGWGRRRLDLTPGVTGLWQVLGRTTISFEEMVKLDYLYVTNWSLWQDVRLLIRTLPAVLSRRGAN
jgi:exopolysaccharide biosynthesis polyprenyl glycosylphosphotransferase